MSKSKMFFIGEGRFGKVYKYTFKDGSTAAAKCCKAANEEEIHRFRREIRVQSQLKHKNIVPILLSNIDNDVPFFFMPLAETNLECYLNAQYGEDELYLLYDVLEGVTYAHSNNVIHRDIRPSNVLLYKNENGSFYACVADFGLCKKTDLSGSFVTASKSQLGHILYGSPEQLLDVTKADKRSDIYSLGLLLYKILTGKDPVQPVDINILPIKFRYLFVKATKRNPDERYQQVDSFIYDLKQIIEKPLLYEIPIDLYQRQLNVIINSKNVTGEQVEGLLNIVLSNLEDEVLIMEKIPYLPDHVLLMILDYFIDKFIPIITQYDNIINSTFLVFSYCDTIADFYKTIITYTSNDDLKQTLLRSLFYIGPYHERWHVGHVFASLIENLTDVNEIHFIRDLFLEHPDLVDWHRKYIDISRVSAVIRDVLMKK